MTRALHLSMDPGADKLLSEDPLALLIGMVLDQQVPLEWAFAGPAELARRLGGSLSATAIASMDPAVLSAAFSAKPALHRYPGSMAARVHELCRLLVDSYDGRAENVWKDVTSGSQLLARVKELPGFGDHKAKIFVALLGKQLSVRPPGWLEAASPFGDPGTTMSVADITDPSSLDRVRAYKQDMKAKAKATAKPAAKTKARSKASSSAKPGSPRNKRAAAR
jgi:uncharacterized HhH-GPD family protein